MSVEVMRNRPPGTIECLLPTQKTGAFPDQDKKDNVVQIHMEHYSAIKRKERTAFAATWMDLEILMLSEVSQTMSHPHQMLSLTCEI